MLQCVVVTIFQFENKDLWRFEYEALLIENNKYHAQTLRTSLLLYAAQDVKQSQSERDVWYQDINNSTVSAVWCDSVDDANANDDDYDDNSCCFCGHCVLGFELDLYI